MWPERQRSQVTAVIQVKTCTWVQTLWWPHLQLPRLEHYAAVPQSEDGQTAARHTPSPRGACVSAGLELQFG